MGADWKQRIARHPPDVLGETGRSYFSEDDLAAAVERLAECTEPGL